MRGGGLAVWSAKFSRSGEYVIIASADGRATLYDAVWGTIVLSIPKQPQPINSADISSDGSTIVSASADGVARLWDITNRGSVVERFGFKGHLRSVRHAEF